MAHLLLPGSSSDYATTSHAAVLNVTGDIDVRAFVAADDWTPSSNSIIVQKFGASGNGSFNFGMAPPTSPGTLRFGWRTSGGVNTFNQPSTVATGVSDGADKWIRATLDVDNGSSQHELKYYLSDDGEAWSQLGATITLAGTTDIKASTARLDIGHNQVSTSEFFVGKIYRAQIYDGIDGTLVFDADPSDTSTWNCPTKDFFTENANDATVTLQGDAELVGDCPTGNRMGGTGAIRKPPRYA